jgi:N,N'-diacetyllegionaminate synthase
VKDIRSVERSLGATKQIQPGEQDVRDMALHSVVSIRDIAAGTKIAQADIWVKRPGTGIPARQMQDVVGRVAKRAIAKDRLVSWDDLQ